MMQTHFLSTLSLSLKKTSRASRHSRAFSWTSCHFHRSLLTSLSCVPKMIKRRVPGSCYRWWCTVGPARTRPSWTLLRPTHSSTSSTSLKLSPAPDVVIRKHLTTAMRLLKDENRRLEAALRSSETDFHARLHQYQEVATERSRELEHIRSLHASQLASLREQHEQELMIEKEQHKREHTAARERHKHEPAAEKESARKSQMDKNSGDKAPPPVGRARGRSRGRARTVVVLAGAQAAPTVPQFPAAMAPLAAPREPGVLRPAMVSLPSMPALDSVAGLSSSIDRMAIGQGAHHQQMAAMAPSAVVPQQFQFAPAVTPDESGDGGRPVGRRHRDEFAVVEARPAHIDNKRGTSGSPINVVANYFRLISMPQFCIHQYHVEFTPTVESSRMRRALLVDHMHMFNKCLVFDGMSDLKSPTRLQQDITEVFQQRRTDGMIICVRFKWVQELAPTHPELLRLFNTQMRRNLERLDFVQINRHFFERRAVSSIPKHGLELWQGLVTAIGQHESRVMLVTDTLHKVLRRDSIYDLMSQIEHVPNYKHQCVKRVAGCIVMTPYNNKTYRVDDIDWDQNPACTFDTKDGPKTYADYYRDQYEKHIRHMRQPLLVVRPKDKDLRAGRKQNIYLVPELCVLMGLTDEMRANVSVMRYLAQHTRVEPSKRVRNLLEFMERINNNEAIRNDMDSWGVRLDDSLVTIDARVLPPKKVMQGSNAYRYSEATADFSRETRDTANVTEFVRTLMSVCPPMGVKIAQPRLVLLNDDRPSGFVQGLNQLARGGNIQLAMIVLPNNRKDRYDLIKKEACIDLGLHTQVILALTIGNRKTIRSVATKVAVQLNCKLGGEAWCLEIPLARTMVISYDTYPDSSTPNRSAGAFVASMNKSLTRWYQRISFYDTHEGLGKSLTSLLRDALRQYSQCNDGASPDRIIFFRDGVSDGQIPQVKVWEIDQILASLQALFQGVEHKLAFVVVTKRISTRFFVSGRDHVTNPPPGTVVDSEVTLPERYDFLVSQSVCQGTVAPTHYNVIYETTGLKPDHMQRLAYKLTDLYFNWPGTIRVPAPCQYAHKLAFLAGQSLHAEQHPRLSSTLFYL
ncbi:piwi-like protein 1 [Amblyomma americanum]